MAKKEMQVQPSTITLAPIIEFIPLNIGYNELVCWIRADQLADKPVRQSSMDEDGEPV